MQKKSNKFETFDTYSIIYTSNNDEIYVSNEDISILKNYCWCISNGYASTTIGRRNERLRITMHVLILNPPSGLVVDHINLNKLDNRRENLRVATYSQNNTNKPLLSSNKSGIRGVKWREKDKRWYVYINVNKKSIYAGSSKDFNTAVKIREEAEIKYYGDFRYRGCI